MSFAAPVWVGASGGHVGAECCRGRLSQLTVRVGWLKYHSALRVATSTKAAYSNRALELVVAEVGHVVDALLDQIRFADIMPNA